MAPPVTDHRTRIHKFGKTPKDLWKEYQRKHLFEQLETVTARTSFLDSVF